MAKKPRTSSTPTSVDPRTNQTQPTRNPQVDPLLQEQRRLLRIQNRVEQARGTEGTQDDRRANRRLERSKDRLENLQNQAALNMQQQQRKLVQGAVSNPTSILTPVTTTPVQNAEQGTIDPSTGQLGNVPKVNAQTADAAQVTDMPEQFQATGYQAEEATGEMKDTLSQFQPVQGEVSEEAQVEGQTMEAEDLTSLGIEAPQIEAPRTVQGPSPRTVQEGELISGDTVDMAEVEAATQIEAAQAEPSARATVRGQLDELMQSFEGGETPAWAAGALRNATAQMAARGLGASSLAGQALVQAAMEAALPIAMADAQTIAAFESQNLSNRQQAAVLAAEQRAKFLGMKYDQQFQAKVLNAAKISDIANMNFTAEQQIALENARLAQTVDLANLDARSAKALADAAALANMDMANLSNRQQAAVLNAQAFLQMDMANMEARQQTEVIKMQTMAQSLLSDKAAKNAAAQFNAASEDQVNMFFADLAANISRFNVEQKNAVGMFNTDQTNSIRRFNRELRNQREQFNATNSLIISQANAKWRQDISMAEFDAQNEANRQNAMAANAITAAALEQIWQRESDLLDYAFQSSENSADRALQILTTKLAGEEGRKAIELQREIEDERAFGEFTTRLLFGWGGL